MNTPSPEEIWGSELSRALRANEFIKLVLSRPRSNPDQTENPNQIRVRPIILQGNAVLSFVTRYPTRDETHNFPPDEGVENIRSLLNHPFRSAHLFLSTETLQLDYSKKGRPMLRRTASTSTNAPSQSHDRTKNYLLDPVAPWLHPMGVTDASHHILPSMSAKWKQINKFAEILETPFSSLPQTSSPLHVVDFGCGRGLLTFALYEQLRKRFGDKTRVTGVELREHLVHEANRTARKIGYEGLTFVANDIQHFSSQTPIHGIIALHACDTATDLAMFAGIQAKASFIVCSPCCHKELRPQIQIPPALSPILRFGIQLGQEADMITDSLRALLLESQGYDTKLFEFISLEHTAKNKMILAVKGRGDPEAPRKIKELKAFYGIQFQYLESRLGESDLL